MDDSKKRPISHATRYNTIHEQEEPPTDMTASMQSRPIARPAPAGTKNPAKVKDSSTKRPSRRSPLVTKLRGMFSCWSERSSSYAKNDVYSPKTKPNLTSTELVSPNEQQSEGLSKRETMQQQTLLQLIAGNVDEIDKLKFYIKKALYAVRERDANQKLPNTVPEAVKFICNYLANILSALKQANDEAVDGCGREGPIGKLFGNGKAFSDFVDMIQKMHEMEVEKGSCVCPSDHTEEETNPSRNDRDADDETNGGDHTNADGTSRQRSGTAKKQRRRKRRGGRKH